MHFEKTPQPHPDAPFNDTTHRRRRRPLPLNMVAMVVLALVAIPDTIPASEFPAPDDPRGNVLYLESLLDDASQRYELTVIDSFEENEHWTDRSNSTPVSDLRFIEETPDSEIYRLESNLLKDNGLIRTFQHSYFVHTSFPITGDTHYTLRSPVEIPIRGRPLKLSAWIKTSSRLHQLVFLFRNARGRSISVPAGPLDWDGWKRIDIMLPPTLDKRGRRGKGEYTQFFRGVMLVSHPHEQRQDAFLVLDNLLVLSAVDMLDTPGSNFSDTW